MAFFSEGSSARTVGGNHLVNVVLDSQITQADSGLCLDKDKNVFNL